MTAVRSNIVRKFQQSALPQTINRMRGDAFFKAGGTTRNNKFGTRRDK